MAQRDEMERIRTFMAHVDENAATERRDWSCGIALITPELPRVWDASYFRVDDADSADGPAIAAETIEIARGAGLAHAAVVVADEVTAKRLRGELQRLGFETTRLVVMALRRLPPAPTVTVEAASFDDVAPSRRETTLEFFPGNDQLADQLRELDRRLEATVGGRWFAVREGDDVISRAWLLGADGVGQIEDVATTPPARGRGLARAVVSAAARASRAGGDDLTFVVADADESTPELYRKLGFEPLGIRHRFVNKLG